MNTEVVGELSPGVKDLVVWLNSRGFETCDSGDGSNHAAGMGCAVPFPMVAIAVEPEKLREEADRLLATLKDHGVDFTPKTADCHAAEEATWPQIQASYDPNDGSASIVLLNVLSRDVRLSDS